MIRPWPQTMLWRTFLLVAVLMLLSVLAWFAIYRAYDREPRARQMAQLMESVVNLTRSALLTAHPEKRHALLLELSDREGIHIYPVEENETIAPLPDRQFLQLVAAQLRDQLGPQTRLTLERNGDKAVFVSFRIEEEDENEYWVALPRERIERVIPWQWIGWGLAALLLSLAGAYLLVFRITRPLKALAGAAMEIGRGHTPAPVEESGPSEITTLAQAFNQMSADLARLDSDRALILAGISHDLRTPLTRLRMSIELSGADQATQESMALDIEEMDQTIGQFLDFARDVSGEALQETDLAALLKDLAAN
ncbi:MAG: HAMP domain-containing protein, partial [Proteobacteria bacterium]|nr:HAMP domain-containing protein [Pseudomonadota bacterium]